MGIFKKDGKRQDPPPTPTPEQVDSAGPKSAPEPRHKGNMKNHQNVGSPVGESVIAEKTTIVGEVHSEKAIVVHGFIKGKVDIQNDLRVAETGVVEADVDAENVSVSGKIKGRAVVRSLFELKSTGTIEGEVLAKSVKIDEGGRMIGKIDMQHGSGEMSEADEAMRKKKEFLRGGPKPGPEPGK